jgi:hypothetical protein
VSSSRINPLKNLETKYSSGINGRGWDEANDEAKTRRYLSNNGSKPQRKIYEREVFSELLITQNTDLIKYQIPKPAPAINNTNNKHNSAMTSLNFR